MVSNNDLAWLGGIFDGEGSITIFPNKQKNKPVKYNPCLVVTNSNPEIIANVVRIMSELEVGFYIHERWSDSEKYATVWQLNTRNQKTILTVLKAIYPYLYGKHKVADYVIEFVESRMSHTNKRSPYTAHEITLSKRAMEFNKRGVSKILTDYMRDTDYNKMREFIRSYKSNR